LVRESESERWLTFFKQHGYAVFHQTPNFIRLHYAPDPAGALPVDLMLADEQTFARIRQKSQRCDIGGGLTLSIPSPIHLIAMKLHAIRNPQRFETGVDLQDVKHLINTANIDISSKEFIEILERYATDTTRAGILREFGDESRS
jgi:hypothetical protein